MSTYERTSAEHPDSLPAEPAEVVSPFAGAQAEIPRRKRSSSTIPLTVGVAVVFVGLISGVVVLIRGYLNDPYRTLEPLPIAKYLDGYRALAGSRFKAEVRVEADLGWKESVGRLMLFSVAGESRPIAVMIPAALAKDIYFTKGQVYLAELEVKEGGLIYANACKKN